MKPQQLDLFANQEYPPSDDELIDQLQALCQRGVLQFADDEAWDVGTIVATEGAWKNAGLIAAPTHETIAVAVAAKHLDVPLVTNDSDLTKLARFIRVQVVNVSRFAAGLAAYSASAKTKVGHRFMSRT